MLARMWTRGWDVMAPSQVSFDLNHCWRPCRADAIATKIMHVVPVTLCGRANKAMCHIWLVHAMCNYNNSFNGFRLMVS